MVIVQTGPTKSTCIRVNITAYNPSKIGIFVSEYTFSEGLIKKYFLEILIKQMNIFMNLMWQPVYKKAGRIYLSVNISANYAFISDFNTTKNILQTTTAII